MTAFVVFCYRPSSTKRDIGNFHVVVVQQRKREPRQSCCFADQNLLLLCRSR